MSTVSLDRLAQYTARGAAPPIRECLVALAAGLLWRTLTGSVRSVCITDSDDAAHALWSAEAEGGVPEGSASRYGWTATAITALHGTLYDGTVSVAVTPGAEGSAHVVVRWPGGDNAARQRLHDALTEMLDGIAGYSLGADADTSGEVWTFAVWP